MKRKDYMLQVNGLDVYSRWLTIKRFETQEQAVTFAEKRSGSFEWRVLFQNDTFGQPSGKS